MLTLEKADSGITTVLAQWYAAPCKESFFTEQKGRYGLEVKSTLYNGPYVISLYDAGKEIRLRQNPNYHSEQPAELYGINITLGSTDTPVSYTHLDVYKRQVPGGTAQRTQDPGTHIRQAAHELHPHSARR